MEISHLGFPNQNKRFKLAIISISGILNLQMGPFMFYTNCILIFGIFSANCCAALEHNIKIKNGLNNVRPVV